METQGENFYLGYSLDELCRVSVKLRKFHHAISIFFGVLKLRNSDRENFLASRQLSHENGWFNDPFSENQHFN